MSHKSVFQVLGCTALVLGVAGLGVAFAAQDPNVAPSAIPVVEDAFADFADATAVPAELEAPAKPAILAPSVEHQADLPYIPSYGREAINLVRVLQEDAETAAGGDKSLRYAVRRDLIIRLKDGEWYDLGEAGRLWVVDVTAAQAVGMRIHFANMDLPEGSALFAYSLAFPQILAGPMRERGPLGQKDAWTQTLFGDRVRIEYWTPAKDYPADFEPFLIDQYQHVYRNLYEDAGGIAGQAACLDAMCLGAVWDITRRASAGIGVVNSDSLFCSGTMMNTVAGDFTPYFLTANHCVPGAVSAASTEVYWFYQRAACNSGAIPPLSSVPQSAPCTQLSNSATSDYSLLMIEGALPNPRSQYGWAGWQSGNMANGTACTCIHHPAGNYKRYAPGSKTADEGPCGSDDVLIDWTTGTAGTEPGSSGSGVFRDSDQRFFGQLHCGPSSCEDESTDGYGEFEITYPNISTLLAAGSDDVREPNDSCAAANAVGNGTLNGLICRFPDEDWYSIAVPAGNTVTVTLSFTHANGDVDTSMFASCGGVSLDSSSGIGNSETLQWANPGGATTVFVRVFLFNDFRNSYNMTVNTACVAPANNACASAITVVSGGDYAGNITCASNDGSALCGSSATNRDAWYTFTAPGVAGCVGTLMLTTCGTHDAAGVDTGMDTVVSVHSACPGTNANQIDCNDDWPSTGTACMGMDAGLPRDSAVSVPVAGGQTVKIRVSYFNTVLANGAFMLHVDYVPGAAPAAPTGVAATDNLCDRVDVSWNAVAGATSYEIWRNTVNNSGTATMIGTDTVSPFSDTTGSIGTTYFYWVRARNACGVSGFSATNSGLRTCGLRGDMNCDGLVNNFDIDPFVLALTNPAAYMAAFPGCDRLNGDINGDGVLNNFDIDPFVACVVAGGCP